MSNAWVKIASLGQTANASASTAPITSDVGILVFRGYVNNSDIRDFVVPGDQEQDNGDGSYTYLFKAPYAGWILGYSFTGHCDVPMQIGSYVTKITPQGQGTDVIHVDPNTLQPMQLQNGGLGYLSDAPPVFQKDDRIAIKMNFGYLTGGQSGNINIQAYLHLQYDLASVQAVAKLQPNGSIVVPNPSPAPTPTPQEIDVALLDLGLYCAPDGSAPTSRAQLQDAYPDPITQTFKSINNSRFAPFNCYVTSAAICQQISVNTGVTVYIHTQAGDLPPMRVEAGDAHTEQTLGATQYYVPMGGYFYAEVMADSSSTGGNDIAVSCSVTLTPA
jgi:hypothetical protein